MRMTRHFVQGEERGLANRRQSARRGPGQGIKETNGAPKRIATPPRATTGSPKQASVSDLHGDGAVIVLKCPV